MKKPKQHKVSYLNWNEVEEYIKKRYGRDMRDWSGKYAGKKTEHDKPYQDFWHHIIEITDVHNGSLFYLNKDYITEPTEDEKWLVEIYDIIFKEFGQYATDEGSTLEFLASW